jgi:hypothetical protein
MNAIPYRNIAGNATAKLAALGSYNVARASISNKSDDDIWLHFYDAAAATDVTVGTTTPIHSEFCPYSDGTHYTARELHFNDTLRFEKGIVWAVTKEADSGNTAPDSNAIVNFTYN